MRPFEETAVSFASALVDGNFELAHTFLAPDLQTEFSRESLRECFFRMFRSYTDGLPTEIQFDDEFSLLEWPSKQPGDVGWAYVGIMGKDFVEAVSVTVCDVAGVHLIREIVWRRP